MIRRPPRSTLDRSSAASDVYKRQVLAIAAPPDEQWVVVGYRTTAGRLEELRIDWMVSVSYTHLRAHETVLDLVCRLLLEKKKQKKTKKEKKEKKNKQEQVEYET